MPVQEGDQFVDFKAFKAAMQDWSTTGAHKFNFRYKKSNSLRNIVVCAHDDCPFRVSAIYSSTRQCVVVVSIGGKHNCIGAGQIGCGPSSQQTWLQRILPTSLSIIDLLHSLWCKNMDLRFRHQEAEKYNQAAAVVLTEYAVKLLEKSMHFSSHRLVRFADPNRASVLSYLGKW